MKCPGQDSRYWGPEAISESNCPDCGGPVEFFKDESSRKCRKCGKKVLNPKMDFGCAAYCKFASQCLGTDIPPELMAQRTDLLKDRVAAEVKKFLGRDFKRIGRALKVAEYAGKIQKSEGGDPAIVTLAAYLSAVSDGAAKTAGDDGSLANIDFQTAKSILDRTGAPDAPAGAVIRILESLGDKDPREAGANLKCVHDAIVIGDFSEAIKAGAPDAAPDKPLLTLTGRNILETLLSELGRKKPE